ncbi:B12-binding domain-containing radical SAM protein [Blautia liquoris]|mgnify:CR=1 FL=1|uniref:B12-binding domain-containing radical SAM protein n=1 Tax=Blautia liquoris TaxID=2779518 RepID=A0A7M2RLS4_9FIRM|nr:B12-binding domain-containing radical SAM protein [Blautia liquoris]QOV20290.1 B12-binding domain-containing radical SAM protein [Blautia liquoris]
MRRILLVAVNAKYIHSNLAVYSLKAYAKTKGIPVDLAEYTINQQKDEIMKGIFQYQPDLLCFSCYVWNISFVRELIMDLHKVLPKTKIWVGGPEVSFDADKVLQENAAIDGVMRGEGEKTFARLAAYFCKSKESNKKLENISGLTYMGEKGEIYRNPDCEIMDLSDVPFPYENLDYFDHRIIYYESSRGCPFNCSYCLSSVDKRLRFRDVNLVKKELRFFLDRQVHQVKFVDRTFNCNREHAMEIWKFLLEQDNGITNFHFEIAADLITREELQLFKRMRPGLIQLEIGVQSTNPETVAEIHRKMDFQKVAGRVLEIQKYHNINQHLDLIAGLPYEDYDSFANSFQDVYRLHPEQLQLGFLKVLKGSYMGAHIEEYEGKYHAKEPYEILSTRWLPYFDVLRLKQVEEMVEVYYNSGQYTNLLARIEKKYDNMFYFFEQLGSYYEEHGFFAASHTRIRRYEILMAFLQKHFPKETDIIKELAVLDIYARENAKSRPDFATDQKEYKRFFRELFKKEEETRELLPDYKNYDAKQLMKMTHVEVVTSIYDQPKAFLFDYRQRDPINGSARIIDVTDKM